MVIWWGTLGAILVWAVYRDLRILKIANTSLAAGFMAGLLEEALLRPIPWLGAISGLAIAGGGMLVLWSLGQGYGEGDVKLSGLIGYFLGWRWGLFAVAIAILLGFIYARRRLAVGRKEKFAFAPFLAVGASLAWIVANATEILATLYCG